MLVEFFLESRCSSHTQETTAPILKMKSFSWVCRFVSRWLVYFGLEVRVDSELEEACV